MEETKYKMKNILDTIVLEKEYILNQTNLIVKWFPLTKTIHLSADTFNKDNFVDAEITYEENPYMYVYFDMVLDRILIASELLNDDFVSELIDFNTNKNEIEMNIKQDSEYKFTNNNINRLPVYFYKGKKAIYKNKDTKTEYTLETFKGDGPNGQFMVLALFKDYGDNEELLYTYVANNIDWYLDIGLREHFLINLLSEKYNLEFVKQY